MIKLKRLNDKEFYLNAELVEMIESTPDTVISLTTGKKIIAKDPLREIYEKIINYKKSVSSQDIKIITEEVISD